jgi:hypothetical protein
LQFAFLKPEIQQFIDAHIGADISKLALQKNPFPEVEWIVVLNQIAAKTKAKDKLPTWFECANIIYPSKVSIEQTSSEKTALYKSELLSGISLIDLTAGFGVDDFYFSKRFEWVVHCEMNAELSEMVSHNFLEMKATNIKCFSGDSLQILEKLKRKFDWIYIDPSRRNETKGKVFMLRDCQPNVPELLHTYFKYADNILIKTAPILDITAGLSELENVKKIHIIAVDNEVKELLWEISKDYSSDIQIETVNITKDEQEKFTYNLGESTDVFYSLPLKYLYEPNSAIMKSGGFNFVAKTYQISKLHQHSHLYISNHIIDFPGRIFQIENIISYNKANMKQFLENSKANITTRNFPDTVESIRKKWKIKDGGNSYCFFTTDANHNKIALICTKIK